MRSARQFSFVRTTTTMKIKCNETGKELDFELLSNGILIARDYECGWDVSYKKIDGKWTGHMNGGHYGYRGILKQLNS